MLAPVVRRLIALHFLISVVVITGLAQEAGALHSATEPIKASGNLRYHNG